MPWQFNAYIKFGQVTVPVVIKFMSVHDSMEKANSWVTDANFGEIKNMLKPAADLALKCHYDTTGTTEKYLDVPTFTQGPKLSMGYIIHRNKEASEVIPKAEAWYEHEIEDEEVLNREECLRDYGGKWKELRKTKVAISASVIRRGDYSIEEEKRQVYKDLGVKMDSFHQYFKPHNEKQETPKPSTSKKNYDDNDGGHHLDQPAVEPVAESRSNNNNNVTVTVGSDDGACSNLEGPNDIIIPDNMSSHTGPTRSPATNNSVYSGSQMNDGEDLWNMQGDYYEEKDQDGGYAPAGFESPQRSHHSEESRGMDSPERATIDEDDEELPDIDEIPLPVLPNLAIGSLVKDVSRSGASKKPPKKINVKPKPRNIPSKRSRDEMRPDDSASKENTASGLLGSPKKKKIKSPTHVVSDSLKNVKKKKKNKTLEKNLSDIFAAVDGTSSTKKPNSSSNRKSKRDRKDSDSGRNVALPNTLSTSPISKDLPLNRSPQKEPPTEESLQRSLTFPELPRGGSVSCLSELVAKVSERTNVPPLSPVPTLASTINTLNSSISNNASSPTKGLTSSSAVTTEAPSRTPTTRSRGGKAKPKGKGKVTAPDRETNNNNKRSDKSPIASSRSSIRTLAQRKDYSEKPATLTSSKTLRRRNSSQASDMEADGVTIIHEKERRRRRRETNNPIIKQESLDSIISRVTTTPTSTTKVVFDPEMPVIDLMVRPGEQNGVPPPVSASCTSPLLAPAIDLHGIPENNQYFPPIRKPLTPVRSIKVVSDSQSSSTSLVSVTASKSFTSAADSAFTPVKSRSPPASPVPVNMSTTRASISPVRNTPKLVASPVTLPSESVPKSPSAFNPIAKSLASIVNSPVTISTESSPVAYSKLSRSTTPIASSSFPVTTRRTSVSPFQSTPGNVTVRAVTPIESSPIVPEKSRSITPTPQFPRASRLAEIVMSFQRQSIDDADASIESDSQLSELELSPKKKKVDEVAESLGINPARKRLDINDNFSNAKRVMDVVDTPTTSSRRQVEENVTSVARPKDSPSTSRQAEDNMPTKRQAETPSAHLVSSKRSSNDIRDGARPAKSRHHDEDNVGTSTQIRLSPRVDESVMEKKGRRKARGKSKTLSPEARSILPSPSSISLSQKSSPPVPNGCMLVTSPITTSKESSLRQIPSLKSILEQQDENDLMHALLEDQEEFEVEENLVNEAREKSAAFATILDNYASDGESSNGEEEEQQVLMESSPAKQTFPGVYIKQMMEVSSQDLRNVLQPVNLEVVGPVTMCEPELPFDADLDLYESVKVPTETNMEDSYNLFSYDDDIDKALDTAIANNDDAWLESSPQKRLLDYENSNNVDDADDFPRLSLVGSPKTDSSDSRPESPVEPQVTSAKSISRSSPGPSSKLATHLDKQAPANSEHSQLSAVSNAALAHVNNSSQSQPSTSLDTADQPESSVDASIPVDPKRPLFSSIGRTKTVSHEWKPIVHDENFHLPVRIKREPGLSQPIRKSRRQSSSSHHHRPAIKREPMDSPMSSRSRRSGPISPPKSDKGSSMPPPRFPAPRTPKKMRDSRKHNLNGASNALALRRPLFGGDRSSGSGSSFEDLASTAVGSRVSPRTMSTREIVSDSTCLEACVNLLGQVASKPGIAGKVAGEIGVGPRLKHDDASSSSSAEADVKVVCKVKNTVKNRRGKKKVKEEKKDREKTGTELVLWGQRQAGPDDEEEEDEADYIIAREKHRRGIACIKELIVRNDRLKNAEDEYEPQGDEFDLSQDSICMVYVFDNYAQNSRTTKIQKRKCETIPLEDLTDYYEKYIRRILYDIVDGKTKSLRMDLYRQIGSDNVIQSVNASKDLKSCNTKGPFTEEQFQHIYNHICYDFLPDHRRSDGNYDITPPIGLSVTFTLPYYVLATEALIRIYAYETGLSLERAEMLMRFGPVGMDNGSSEPILAIES